MTKGPLELVSQVATMLDELEIPYALGGSMASSLIGEPRSTVDVDIAIELDAEAGAALLERASAEFYVPMDPARRAIEAHSSFNLIDTNSGLKVDLFVLGEGLLDRMQIERRMNVTIPGHADRIWVTSPEDQVLRKLDWYRSTGHESQRQWRDVIGILRIHGDAIDHGYLSEIAPQLGLGTLLDEATTAAAIDL
jgi:hypothetical protein